jgi:predicted nucleic acid-binding protein
LFANRYTAYIDACSLAGALKRNLLLTLAEAEFFRVRWSNKVMEETARAIHQMLVKRGIQEADAKARAAVTAMTDAFEDAMVAEYDDFLCVAAKLPDQGDAHVLAAAVKTRAHVIVTDNMRHFPIDILKPLNIEAATTDDFLANTITLNPGKSVSAIRRMRERFNQPEKTPAQLFLDMEASGLTATVNVLRPYEESL